MGITSVVTIRCACSFPCAHAPLLRGLQTTMANSLTAMLYL